MARKPMPCGTETAYRRHLRSGEKPCQACKDAHAAYQLVFERDKRAAAQGRTRPQTWDDVLDRPSRLLKILNRLESREEAA